MADGYLVFVADDRDEERGNIRLFTDAGEAARHAELLLEAGHDQSRIRVFSSRELDLQVTQRPVVSLADGAGTKESGTGDSPDDVAVDQGDDQADDGDGVVPGVKDGVRMSSLFKSG